MLKRLLIILFVVFTFSTSNAATQTINTLPNANATFMTDLQTFLRNEAGDRANLSGCCSEGIFSGGIGATDATLTHTISTVTAFVNGYYVTDAAISHTYTANKRTFVYLRKNGATAITIAGATITYDDNFVFAEMISGSAQPVTPTGTAPLFYADTSGAAITTVVDLRVTSVVIATMYPDYRVIDHGAVGSNSNIKYFVDLIGTTNKATIYLRHNSSGEFTDYNFATADNYSANTNISFVFERGARIVPSTGVNVILPSPSNIIAQPNQQIFSGAGTVKFSTGTGGIYPDWFPGTDTQKVQLAVTSCLANYVLGDSKSIPMLIPRKFTLTSAINIDRPVNGTFELFRIIGEGADAGFYTALNDGSSMFTSTIDATAPKTPVSEGIVFENIKFASSATNLSNFSVDGTKFLRITFNHCIWDKIRLAYSDYYFQSWFLDHPTITGVTGIFMEVNPVGGSAAQGSFYNCHITGMRDEGNNTQTGLIKGTFWDGCSIVGGLYENAIGPLLDASVFGGEISGLYVEQTVAPLIKLNASNGVLLGGNLFSTAFAGADYAVDCGTSANVSSVGNTSGGNYAKISAMIPVSTGDIINGPRGFSTLGDVAITGNLTDIANTARGEHIAEQAVLTGASFDSLLALGDKGQIIVTITEEGVGGVGSGGVIATITRVGTYIRITYQAGYVFPPGGETITVATPAGARFTRAAGDWTTAVGVGSRIAFGGFANAGNNNAEFSVTAVSALVLDTNLNTAVAEGPVTNIRGWIIPDFSITCSAATGYKVRFTNTTAGIRYLNASIIRVKG